MNQSKNNFFDLPNAENLYCKVKHYQNSLLEIIVFDVNGEFCSLVFTPTYIQCPMDWKGADFRLASPEELLKFREILDVNMTEDEFLHYLQLFIVQANATTLNPTTVHILASHVEKYMKESNEHE